MIDHALVLQMFTPGEFPIVFTEDAAGAREMIAIVSDHPLAHARRHVRVANPAAYAIAFVNREDKIVIELAHRGDAHATLHVFTDGVGTLAQTRRSMIDFDPQALRWTGATADVVAPDAGVVHVVAHRLDSPQAVERTVRFLRGRAERFAAAQRVIVDTDAQTISPGLRAQLALAVPMPVEWR